MSIPESTTEPEFPVSRPFRQQLAKFLIRRILAVALLLLGILFVPYLWCVREAAAWFDGDAGTQQRLALGVAAWTSRDGSNEGFSTGSGRFDGKWHFGRSMMAGFGQTALEHPEWRDRRLHRVDRCLARLLDDNVQQFSSQAWRDDPLDSDMQHHATYLGYINLALGLHHFIDPDFGLLICSYSIAATGFSLAAARGQQDRDFFRRLYATSYLFGAPQDHSGRRNYVSGGPLGDVIMFAVLTARPSPTSQQG